MMTVFNEAALKRLAANGVLEMAWEDSGSFIRKLQEALPVANAALWITITRREGSNIPAAARSSMYRTVLACDHKQSCGSRHACTCTQ